MLKEPVLFEQAYALPWDKGDSSELKKVLMDNKDFFVKFLKDNYLEELSNKFTTEAWNKLAQITKRFVLITLEEMKNSLSFQSEVLSDLGVVFFQKFDQNQLRNLAHKFFNIIQKEEQRFFQNELERFAISFSKIQYIKLTVHFNPLEIWHQEKESFPLLYRLAKAILVLPHSTVPVERAFSQLKDFKTGKRNRLSVKNLEACLLIYQNYGNDPQSIITNEMLDKCQKINENQVDLEITERKDDVEEGPEQEPLESSFDILLRMEEEKIKDQEISQESHNSKKTKAKEELPRSEFKRVKKN